MINLEKIAIILITILWSVQGSLSQEISLTGAAITSNNAYVLLWGQNEAIWSGVPKSLSDKILELNKEGKVIKKLDPVGVVFVQGEYWNAKSVDGIIDADETIEIVRLEGLRLKVKRKDS